jgi:hypothetical protein
VRKSSIEFPWNVLERTLTYGKGLLRLEDSIIGLICSRRHLAKRSLVTSWVRIDFYNNCELEIIFTKESGTDTVWHAGLSSVAGRLSSLAADTLAVI